MDMLIVFSLIVFCYLYRLQLLRIFLRYTLWSARTWVKIRLWYYKEPVDYVEIKSIEQFQDGASLYNIESCFSGKIYDMKVVFDTQRRTEIPTNNEFRNALLLRNRLVHCNIMTHSDEIICDITQSMRQFCYHFDKNDKCSTLKYFIEYVLRTSSNNGPVNLSDFPNIMDMKFVLYRNDEMLSEYTCTLSEITDKTYMEIMGRDW